jgi:hypothetical protein
MIGMDYQSTVGSGRWLILDGESFHAASNLDQFSVCL